MKLSELQHKLVSAAYTNSKLHAIRLVANCTSIGLKASFELVGLYFVYTDDRKSHCLFGKNVMKELKKRPDWEMIKKQIRKTKV